MLPVVIQGDYIGRRMPVRTQKSLPVSYIFSRMDLTSGTASRTLAPRRASKSLPEGTFAMLPISLLRSAFKHALGIRKSVGASSARRLLYQ